MNGMFGRFHFRMMDGGLRVEARVEVLGFGKSTSQEFRDIRIHSLSVVSLA